MALNIEGGTTPERRLLSCERQDLIEDAVEFPRFVQCGAFRANADSSRAMLAVPRRRLPIESTVHYLGIQVDDAIEIAEKIDI